MRAFFGLLAVGLCAQATFGEMQFSLKGASPVKQEGDHRVSVAAVLQDQTVAGSVYDADVPVEDNRQLQARSKPRPEEAEMVMQITDANPDDRIEIEITIASPDGSVFKKKIVVFTNSNGIGELKLALDVKFLNRSKTDMCDRCTMEETVIKCKYGNCKYKLLVKPHVAGDPHMVGLLGQKIDWAGEDKGWYCLFSDGPDFHVNIRLSAPMPEEFPDRQLISAVSILTEDGLHSLVVEVKDPYTTTTNGCPKDASVLCLADGGLRIRVDGEDSPDMQAPVENVRLPGTSPVVVSAANLPAECRPFGGDRIWATKFADMMANQRSLRLDSVSFAEWILQPVSLAAPTWCAKFLEEEGATGIISTRAEHATFRVETLTADIRINVGVNYQDLETVPVGTVRVPELEFWQTDLGFDGLHLSDSVAGLMGDTSRFVLDDEGMPVTSGLGALHGPVESYRVAGPFSRDFDKLHG